MAKKKTIKKNKAEQRRRNKAIKKARKDKTKVNGKLIRLIGLGVFVVLAAMLVGAYFLMSPKNPTEISFTAEQTIITIGEIKKPSVLATPHKNGMWDSVRRGYQLTSSDEKVCTIRFGKEIVGIKTGTATITATSTADKNITATLEVTVVEVAHFSGFENLRTNLKINEVLDISGIKYIEDGVEKEVSFTSIDSISTTPKTLQFGTQGQKSVEFTAVNNQNLAVSRKVSFKVFGNINFNVKPESDVKLSSLVLSEMDTGLTAFANALGVTATDSFASVLPKSIVCLEGENEVELKDILAGKIYDFVVTVQDPAGNVESAKIENVKVYDTPVLTYSDTAVLDIPVGNFASTDLVAHFGASAVDSFGGSIVIVIEGAPPVALAGEIYDITLAAIDTAGNRSDITFKVSIT